MSAIFPAPLTFLLSAIRSVANAFVWFFWKLPVKIARAFLAHASNVLAVAWLGGLAAAGTTATIRAIDIHKKEVAERKDAGLDLPERDEEAEKAQEAIDRASYFKDGFEDPEIVMYRQLMENELEGYFDLPKLADGGRPVLDGGRYSMDGGAAGTLAMLRAVAANRGQPTAADVEEIRELFAESNSMTREEVDLMFPDGGILTWLKKRRDFYKDRKEDPAMTALYAEIMEDKKAGPRPVAAPTPVAPVETPLASTGNALLDAGPVPVPDLSSVDISALEIEAKTKVDAGIHTAVPLAPAPDAGPVAQAAPTTPAMENVPTPGTTPTPAPAAAEAPAPPAPRLPTIPVRDVRDVGSAALLALTETRLAKGPLALPVALPTPTVAAQNTAATPPPPPAPPLPPPPPVTTPAALTDATALQRDFQAVGLPPAATVAAQGANVSVTLPSSLLFSSDKGAVLNPSGTKLLAKLVPLLARLADRQCEVRVAQGARLKTLERALVDGGLSAQRIVPATLASGSSRDVVLVLSPVSKGTKATP